MVNWQAVSAIGSLLAVGAALFIALGGSWARDKIFGPKVSIEFGHAWPFIVRTGRVLGGEYVLGLSGESTSRTIDLGPSFWIRIRIRNKGGSVAKQCKVKLLKVRYERGDKDLEGFDPVLLRWVSPPPGSERFKPLNILPHETELCDVLSLVQAHAPVAEIECDMEPRGAVTSLDFGEQADYWLEIVAFGENFKPARKTLQVGGTGRWASGSHLPDLKVRESARGAE